MLTRFLDQTTLDTSTAPLAATLLRLTLGTAFLAHGLLKVLVFTPAGTVAFFEQDWKGTCRVHETVRKVYMIR